METKRKIERRDFMENKTEINKMDEIKKIMRDNSDLIIGSCVYLAMGLLCYKVGYYKGYKIGRDKGITVGKNRILDSIVDVSCENGLIMRSPEIGRYVFTARKLND